jgi:hypothetical protein
MVCYRFLFDNIFFFNGHKNGQVGPGSVTIWPPDLDTYFGLTDLNVAMVLSLTKNIF